MTTDAIDMSAWQLETTVDRGPRVFSGIQPQIKYWLAPAILSTRTSRLNTSRQSQSVTIEWATSDETFAVHLGNTVEPDGQRLVTVRVETSDGPGYVNGFARIVAVEISPGEWQDNQFASPTP